MAVQKNDAVARAERRIELCKNQLYPSLDLSNLSLREIPESVRGLRHLQSLNLDDNRIAELPAWIGDLDELRTLRVQHNPVRRLPASLAQLQALQALFVDADGALAGHEVVAKLGQLQTLAVRGAGLTQLPAAFKGLRRLKALSLYGNRFVTLPEWLGDLEALESLSVPNNQLRALPRSLSRLTRLQTLEITGNPALEIPVEIAEHGDARKVLAYYFTVSPAGAAQPLNEFKLMLVGRGNVGKTTLVHRLMTDDYAEFPLTPGIQIKDWQIELDGEPVQAHVWDFGGQEILHGTHRLFMTERAVYLILLSGREGNEDHDADYWLSLVRSFAGDVPVVVLLHKTEDYPFQINRGLLSDKYGPNLHFLQTDSKTGLGIAALRNQIAELAGALPGLKAAWPKAWRQVRDELPSEQTNYLPFDAFRRFCSERGVGDAAAQETLADSLHDLGLMLSYRHDRTLQDFGVLNPQWVTRGIYTVLSSSDVKDALGQFSVKTLAAILPEDDYPASLHPYLIALMAKFHICFPLAERGGKQLIPELMSKEEPKLDDEFPPARCLNFIYEYKTVMPEGLLSRFIAETYVHREPRHAWRTGVVLERGNCRALVRGDLQARTITIRVTGIGTGQRELLGIIREHFDRIHRSYARLPIVEMVPIPGFPDTLVSHDELLVYERNGEREILRHTGQTLQRFSVKTLLDGIDLPGAPRRPERTPGVALDRTDSQIRIFVAYSRKDEMFLDELKAALMPYSRFGHVELWFDSLTEIGVKWEPEIHRRLDSADVVILLLSNDFMSSSYCMDIEVPKVMRRVAENSCVVAPILIRDCAFTKTPLGEFQAITAKRGRAVNLRRPRDRAWLEVTEQLDPILARVRARRGVMPSLDASGDGA